VASKGRRGLEIDHQREFRRLLARHHAQPRRFCNVQCRSINRIPDATMTPERGMFPEIVV
jgi:hypothetical protein